LTRSGERHQKYQINEEKCTDSEPPLLRLKEFKRNLMNAKNAFLAFEKLKEGEERDLLIEVERAITILNRTHLKLIRIIEDRSRPTMETEEKSFNADSACTSDFKLFSIETWGSAWTDGLVFTVTAENDVWAEEIVRQWLKSNGRENHKIDKVQALVSKNVRGVVNVGAKLLDV
jgi:hypothetical protein